MTSRVVTNTDEFENLQKTWNELYNSNPHHTPYQSWEWNYTWWKNFGVDERLRLIVIEEGHKLVGIAPFYLRKTFYGFPLSHFGFIGQKRTDYLDFIIADGEQEKFFSEFSKCLKELETEWRFIDLKDIPQASPNIDYLLNGICDTYPFFSFDLKRLCVTLPLTDEWQTFLKTLGKRTRRDVNYDRRYIQKHCSVDFKIYTNASFTLKGFDDLVAIYQSRWEEEQGAGRFADEAVSRFEKEICHRFSNTGDYRLYLLYANEQPVAGLAGYIKNKKYYADIYAHSPAYHKYSVGNILLGRAIEDCIGLQLTELDLSRGDERYKFRWHGQPKRNYHIKIFRNRVTQAQAAIAEQLYESASESQWLNNALANYRRFRFGKERA